MGPAPDCGNVLFREPKFRRQVAAHRQPLRLRVLELTLFHRLAITRVPNGDIVRRILELRHNNSASDATYVAIAEKLKVPLITRDKRLANSSGHAARIEYIA
ncbi:MAG TPA: type II toxin-antitoxin system VapC family toxin [Thermoanaerobaculia bacterium]|nr:type II toxin-antitoxin system VapC family toxin [Thermoanaerobaculia bacterium]